MSRHLCDTPLQSYSGAANTQQSRSFSPRSALQQAVKLKRNSWQTQENLARAALACKEYVRANNALMEVLKYTHGER